MFNKDNWQEIAKEVVHREAQEKKAELLSKFLKENKIEIVLDLWNEYIDFYDAETSKKTPFGGWILKIKQGEKEKNNVGID